MLPLSTHLFSHWSLPLTIYVQRLKHAAVEMLLILRVITNKWAEQMRSLPHPICKPLSLVHILFIPYCAYDELLLVSSYAAEIWRNKRILFIYFIYLKKEQHNFK
jgi:hypothetical protein